MSSLRKFLAFDLGAESGRGVLGLLDGTRITLEVRETNLAAQLFFRHEGFKALKVLRSFYEDSGEDAYLLQYRLADDTGDDFEETVNRIAQYEES